MKNAKHVMIAAAASVAASAAFAAPVFENGFNTIYYNNLENQYRSNDSCDQIGGCLGAGTGPDGYQLVDFTVAGNVAQGDIFAGVLRVQNIDSASTGGSWFQSGTDQFQGYFAQEVTNVGPIGTAAEITFGNVTVDPFGILSAGEMFRFYVDNGATTFNDATTGSVMDVINLATDGVFWASLGLTGGANGGYAYAIDDLTAPGTSTTTESFLGLNLIATGAGYNAGELALLNDVNESIAGGVSAGFLLCTPGDIADANVQCTDFVGTSEVEANSFYGLSPFVFASNDPALIYRIPEPATLSVLGLGLLGLAASRRRKA